MKGRLSALAILAFFSLFYPSISGYSLTAIDLSQGFIAPCLSHPAGTDIKGIDTALKIAFALRLSILIALLSTAISLTVGLSYGIFSGVAGGLTDRVMMRIVDILYGLPFTMLVIVLVALFGRSLVVLFAALGLVQWLTIARIARGQTLQLKSEAYVEYAIIAGTGRARIVATHILPNMMNVALTYATLLIPAVILEESFISYLGLGVKPPAVSLGGLISEGFRMINPVGFYPWVFVAPLSVLVAVVYLFFSTGAALKEKYER